VPYIALMRQFTRGAHTFDVDDAGPSDGPVVVLLHGFPENRSSWQAMTPSLVAAGFRVLAPDQRGYSPGARPLNRHSYVTPELVADVLALVDASGADKVHLVGHDWGGYVAWAFALAHPDRLHTVTSLTTPHPQAFVKAMYTGSQALHSWYMAMFQLPWLPEAAITARGGANFKRGLLRAGLDEAAAERYVAPLRARAAARAAVNWYRGLLLSPTVRGNVTVPAMYVYATGDRFLSAKAARLTADFVDAPYRYERREGRSHWLPEEEPEEMARLVIEFAREHTHQRSAP
jgi:pimeloyl-ACP methyl ester carboxylesterase